MAIVSAIGINAMAKAPDFRYPETVINEATTQIKKAEKKGNDKLLIDGMIRLSLAKASISDDNLPALTAKVDSLAANAKDVRTKALLLGLEGDMLVGAYNNDRYKYDQRQKAGTTRSKDIREWSHEDYRDRILELSEVMLADSTELLATPIDKYRDIILPSEVLPEFAPTLYDMLAHHSIQQIRSFSYDDINKEAKQRIDDIYASLLSSHKEGDAAYIYSLVCSVGYRPDKEAIEQLKNVAKKYADSPYSVEIIDKLADNAEDDAEVVKMMRRAVVRHASYPGINALRNHLYSIDQQKLHVWNSELATSQTPITLRIRSQNLNRVKITAYSLPFDFPDNRDSIKAIRRNRIAKEITFALNNDKDTTIEFSALPVGKYALIPTFTDRGTGRDVVGSPDFITVSDIDIMMATSINGDERLIVVDATTSKPIEGAKVTVSTRENGTAWKTLTTDKDGYAIINGLHHDTYYYFQAVVGDDHSRKFGKWINNRISPNQTMSLHCSVFTDRGVYRPGETVNFAVVAYRSGQRALELAKKQVLTVELINRNWKTVETKEITTDEFGRINGSMAIPTDGLTGMFTIRIKATGDNNVGSARFEVSEYKAPTFYIEVDHDKCELKEFDKVKICGHAMTYSQFPLANTKIEASFEQGFSWWWDDVEIENYETETVTDANGNFSVTIPADKFSGKEGELFVRVTLRATDSRGETQSTTERMKIGKLASLPTLNDITANALRPVEISNDLKNFDLLNYSILDSDSTQVMVGQLTPDAQSIDCSGLESGEYTVKVSMPNGKSKSLKLRLYRPTDNHLAFTTPLVVDADESITCDADGSFSIRWGNSFESYFYYIITCDGKVTDFGWQGSEAGMHDFKAKAEFTERGKSGITIYHMEGHSVIAKNIALLPATPQDSIEIVAETFRDNITPGAKETWKLRIKNNNGKTFRSAVIANMYDAALNSIMPNTYTFAPTYYSWNMFSVDTQPSAQEHSSHAETQYDLLNYAVFSCPWLNYYGEGFYTGPRYGFNSLRLMKMSANTMVGDAAPSSADLFECETRGESETIEQEAETDKSSTAQLRNEGVKTAFFLPGLVTNEHGEVTFTFEVPNRNTQWQFSAIAYTDDLHAHYINRLVTAAKELMVSPNVPRFVREGDKLEVQTAVINNTDNAQTVDVTIEINDTKRTFSSIVLEPKTSKTLISTYDVPTTATNVVVTTGVARNGRMIDGQRDCIAVLTATTDVVEAAPFYLNSNDSHKTLAMPHFNGNGRMTIEYSDNPAWYAATALPSMRQTAETASAHILNYYISKVASSILDDNPEIAEAIDEWTKSKSLKSNLQKNEDLKIISLNNTPWVRLAETETDMMQHLADFTDPVAVQQCQQKAISGLYDLQKPDGGFGWFKGCFANILTTEEVLWLFGNLNEMGVYPQDDATVSRIVRRAVAYCDKYYTERSKKATDREWFIAYATDYVYTRSLLPVAAPTGAMKQIVDEVIKRSAEKWGDFTVTGKSKAAVLLANSNHTKEAKDIVESLRQFAVKSADHGTYWDVDVYDKVLVASVALKAFYKVNPNDPTIEGIRQWLLLAKETQYWGSTVNACNAINSILSTGKSWTKRTRKAPTIKIGSTTVDTSGATPYFGYIRREITTDKSGDISIRRDSGCPAWGAVYCQYSAPMDSVKSHANNEVKIEKQFFVYDGENKLVPAATTSFRVGQRIQVRLTVRSERDIDYVAITDDRGACFEPVNQTSVYEWQEGNCIYHETRDSATNLFIPRIDKGTYVITYDVYANNAGSYASGIASLQCQYAPAITAHSAGSTLTVEQK